MSVTDPNGLVWVNRGPDTDDHLAFAGHETYLVQIARSLLPKGGTFLDVGAHVGLYTLNLASKAGNVFAVEANPVTFKVLTTNIEANREKFPDCKIHHSNFAAWDKPEELSLIDANDKDTGGSTRCVSIWEGTTFTTSSGMEFQILTKGKRLDDVLLPEPRIDLVKIDVEGAEARVLKGMCKRIMRDRPVLLIEMHDVYFGEHIRINTLAILEALGYDWNEDLTFGGSYYLLAQPHEADQDVMEIVKAGQ